jgi:hypothetical protein
MAQGKTDVKLKGLCPPDFRPGELKGLCRRRRGDQRRGGHYNGPLPTGLACQVWTAPLCCRVSQWRCLTSDSPLISTTVAFCACPCKAQWAVTQKAANGPALPLSGKKWELFLFA